MKCWERPVCRKAIEENGYFPLVLVTKDNMVWDGHTIWRSDGSPAKVSGSMRKQMVKMCREGRWPEITDVVIDEEIDIDQFLIIET